MITWILLGLAPVAIIGFCLWQVVAANNRVVALDARCKTAFADIDVQLKRRADLIPGLVECVRGFAGHEAKILEEVVDARKASLTATPEGRQQAEAAVGRKVTTVFTLAEKYPELAASSHFRELRQELGATADRIAAARRFLNLAVEEYNATLGQFPANLVGARRRLSERRPYDLGVERMIVDEPVAVSF